MCPLELTLQLTRAAMSFFAVRDTPPPATPFNYFLESHDTLYIGICLNSPLFLKATPCILQQGKQKIFLIKMS